MATVSVCKKIIKASRYSGVPIMLWSSPGQSKSAIVKQVAEELGINFLDIRAAYADPGDFMGLPAEILNKHTGEKEMRFLISSFLPKGPDFEGIFFLDEMPCASKEVMNCLLELSLDRRIRMTGYELPKGVFIVAAGNPFGYDNYVTELPGALRSRFLHVNLSATQDEWFDYASKKGFKSDVIRFAASFPKYLQGEVQEFDLNTIKPNKRSFEMLSSMMKQFKDKTELDECVTVVASGLLGTEAGIQYSQFIKSDYIKIETNKILKNYNEIRSIVQDFVERGLVPEQKCAVDELISLKELNEKNLKDPNQFNNLVTFLSDLTSDIAYTGVIGIGQKSHYFILELAKQANNNHKESKKLYDSMLVLTNKESK